MTTTRVPSLFVSVRRHLTAVVVCGVSILFGSCQRSDGTDPSIERPLSIQRVDTSELEFGRILQALRLEIWEVRFPEDFEGFLEIDIQQVPAAGGGIWRTRIENSNGRVHVIFDSRSDGIDEWFVATDRGSSGIQVAAPDRAVYVGMSVRVSSGVATNNPQAWILSDRTVTQGDTVVSSEKVTVRLLSFSEAENSALSSTADSQFLANSSELD